MKELTKRRVRCGFIIGPSGSGKGYGIGAVLKEYTNTAVFVTGDWCRDNAKDLADKGVYVNDDLITAAGKEEFGHQKRLHGENPFSFLFDAPRTLAQVKAFGNYYIELGLIKDLSELLVLHIHAKPITSIGRMIDRADRQGREDDKNPKIIRRRSGNYYGDEAPDWTFENPQYLQTGGVLHEVVPWLQEHTDYHHIDGEKDLEVIRAEVRELAPKLFTFSASPSGSHMVA